MAQNYLKTQRFEAGTRFDFQLGNSTAPKRLELGLQNFMWNQFQGSTKLFKNFSRIGQAIRHLIGSRLSTRIIYFSITIRVRGLKFYVHKLRIRIFIVYKFRKNRITNGGEKGEFIFLKDPIRPGNSDRKIYLLNIYDSRN